MKNLTIGKRIVFGFSLLLFFLLVLGLFTHSRVNVIQRETANITTNGLPSLEYLSEAQESATMNRLLVFKHIDSKSAQDMDDLESKINANSEKISKDLEGYEKSAQGEALKQLQNVKDSRTAYVNKRHEILAMSRAATNAEASALVYAKARAELDPVALAYSQALAQLKHAETLEEEEGLKTILTAVNTTNLAVWIVLAVAFGIGCAAAFMVIRGIGTVLKRISASLADGAGEVSAAAMQVSGSSQSLAEGSSEQAASIEETSASLEELSSMTRRNSENAERANTLAREARAAAEKGVSDMNDMSGAMSAIKGSGDDIAKIIKTIDEIAFQTNILALNAAVEAARAGEAGMGFAVVADEVRNLAQRSAEAAKETAGKIEAAITNTARGVNISEKVAQALGEIVVKARQVDELAAEVASASREQASGIVQINTAIGQMDKVTQSNASNAEECAAAAEEMNAQALTMKTSVAELVLLVEGATATPAASATEARLAPVRAKTPVTAHLNGQDKTTGKNGASNAIPMPAPARQDKPIGTDDFKNF